MNDKICPACQIELRCKQNGAIVVEMAVYGPMAIWRGDLFYCPRCKNETIIGLGAQPEIRDSGDAGASAAFHARLDSYDLDKSVRVHRVWLNEKEKSQYEAIQLRDMKAGDKPLALQI